MGAQPIGTIMAQIDSDIDVNDVAIPKTPSAALSQASQKVLSGSQLNDDDDAAETLESLKSAEHLINTKMDTPEFTDKNLAKQGHFSQDFLAEDRRVYTKYLDDALVDKDVEDKLQKNKENAKKREDEQIKKQHLAEVKKAEMETKANSNEDNDDLWHW